MQILVKMVVPVVLIVIAKQFVIVKESIRGTIVQVSYYIAHLIHI